MHYDIFISAKSEDLAHARRVRDFLAARGLEVFLSAESLRSSGTTEFQKAIDAAIENSEHMVVVTSAAAHVAAPGSPWVEKEWRSFLNEKLDGRKHGNLVSVITGGVDPAQVPLSLRSYEAIRLDKPGLQRLIDYLSPAVLPRQPVKSVAPSQPPSWRRSIRPRAWYRKRSLAFSEWTERFPVWFWWTLVGVAVMLLVSLVARDQGFVPSREIIAKKLYVIVHPEESGARYELAKAYSKAGYHDMAIDQYLRVLEQKPDSPDSLWELGLTYYQNGDLENAETVLLSYLEQDAESWHAAAARDCLRSMGVEPPDASSSPQAGSEDRTPARE